MAPLLPLWCLAGLLLRLEDDQAPDWMSAGLRGLSDDDATLTCPRGLPQLSILGARGTEPE